MFATKTLPSSIQHSRTLLDILTHIPRSGSDFGFLKCIMTHTS